jgi:hypothetical protein
LWGGCKEKSLKERFKVQYKMFITNNYIFNYPAKRQSLSIFTNLKIFEAFFMFDLKIIYISIKTKIGGYDVVQL